LLKRVVELWAKGIVKTPLCHCLGCGHKFDAGANPDNDQDLPGPGDVTVCLKCGAVMKYADDMTVRGMTDAEIDELTNDMEWMGQIARVVGRVNMVRHSAA
jgi:hypothetical protein